MLRLVLRLILPAAVVASSIAVAQLSDPCDVAQELMADGFLKEAEEQFSTVLDEAPRDGCAQIGLKELMEQQCSAAAKLVDEGALSQATKRYSALIENAVADDGGCAAVGLRRAVRVRCQSAEDLLQRRLVEQALKAFGAILDDKDASLEHVTGSESWSCAASGLEDVEKERCQVGRDLESISATEAREFYLAILSNAASGANSTLCAVAGLARVGVVAEAAGNGTVGSSNETPASGENS